VPYLRRGQEMGIMHLTYLNDSDKNDAVSSTYTGEAGAPGTEVEITPEMIDAGTEIAWRTPIMEPDEALIRQMVRDIFSAMSLKLPARRL
jgi:hypothetical protein